MPKAGVLYFAPVVGAVIDAVLFDGCHALLDIETEWTPSYAERKNNDITLSTVNGKVTHHISGSW
jgi:hypothetical protein